MRVLITLERSPMQRYLVQLFTKEMIKEVKDLINSKKYSKAAHIAFAKGLFEREIFEEDLASVDADLLLSDSNVRWDLKK